MSKLLIQIKSLWGIIKTRLGNFNFVDLVIVIIGVELAILLRLPLLDFKSSDFYNSLKPWYLTIHSTGFAAFKTNFTTYNPPYLYLLYIIARIFPDLDKVLAIKIPSLITDFICAYFVYLIVELRYPKKTFAIIAALIFLYTPTVVLNSAFWGQADVLFTAPLLASIYLLMIKKNTLAFIAFGISLAFKLQALFLMPLLVGLLLRKEVSWKHFLLIPLVLFIAVLPAWFAGRPLPELLGVYVYQTQQYQLLEMTAATVYTWMPDVGLTQKYFTFTGVVFAASLSFIFAILIFKSKVKLTNALLLKLALVSVLFVPFFLPKMHDRYFFPADVISIIFAFYFPEFFFVPVIIITSSFFAYQSTLFLVVPVPYAFLAAANFVVLVIIAKDAFFQLFKTGIYQELVSEEVK
jgi:Gpi18-like mannosyltransferase